MQVLTEPTTLRTGSSVISNNTINLIENKGLTEQQKLRNSKYTILLVEDEPIIQKVHSSYLSRLGYKFELAANGMQAINLYKNHPDLILLDIGLPDMDGVQTCAAIRHIEREMAAKSPIPIIALTAYNEEEVKDCWTAGVDYIAYKPLKLTTLESLLSHYLAFKANLKKETVTI